MNGNQAARLAKVVDIFGIKGCRLCRHWDATIVQIVAPPVPGENVTPFPFERPERCDGCGRRPPTTTAVVQIVAPEVDDENAGIAT